MRGAPRDATVRELKFRSLAGELRRGILAGEWVPGAKLPTEKELVTRSGLSLTTVRRAFDELAEQGLVVRRQGAGTFVAERTTPPRVRRTVGVLVPSTTQYYPSVLAGIESALSAASARLVLACSQYDGAREDTDIASLLDSDVDGLLLAPTLHDIEDPQRRVAELMQLQVPVVLLERRPLDAGTEDRSEHVCTDHAGGAMDAVQHLVDLGHTRIGLVCRSPNPTGDQVLRGYREALARLSLPELGETFTTYHAWAGPEADQAIASLREAGATAALAFGDREAAFLEGAASRAGVRIPEDLAIVSYDDETADIAAVPLTAVSPPKFRIGETAVGVLLRRITEGDACPVQQIRLRPRIVVRESCGAQRVHPNLPTSAGGRGA
ncbi:GntR family transcriptional regulator [Luteipulveratus mongoliensis]|uniref:GntR family transcriptional regulator n=1 Tax=Luteipulveratus mongoliensis TaxID=571913 RepID=A0A0K1JI38_9MICO|nr:GntR family transcriptional regulator [Luteipulveratus mongoliensis]